MNKPLLPATLAALLLTGCSLAPKYERPASPVAATYGTAPAASAAASPAPLAADIGWREFFTDPRLQRLITLALENNRDLRVAALNVNKLRATYDIAETAYIPTLDATATATRQRQPADLSPSGRAATTSTYKVGLASTSYELDLFGRVASLRDQALEEYLSTEEARRSTLISLVAAVATQYLTLVSLDEQLALAQQTYDSLKSSYDITRKSYDIGNTSELDLSTSQAQLQGARATLADYARQREQAAHALAVLIGRELPADLPASGKLSAQTLLADLPAGLPSDLPSDLLQRRPDILQAEHSLKSANANIGVARAAFFPSITLTAFGGTSSAQLSGLFKKGSGTWSFTPDITLPIFAGGVNSANLKIAKIDRQIDVANYEKTIQTAFQEVADSLSARAYLDEQLDAQAARLAAQQKRFDLSDLRYRNGADSYLVLLLAQEDLYTAQQSLIQVRLSRLTNLINLYKALGGGWTEVAAK